MSKKTNLFVALGLAGAAYYLFNMKPEKKDQLKNQIKKIKDEAMNKIPQDIKDKFNSKLNNVKEEVK